MPMVYDAAIRQLIMERLQQDKRTAGAMVDVSCTDGCIRLIGQVDSEEQKKAALFIIEGLPGISNISDQIIVRER